MIGKHSSENCPAFNAKSRKIAMEYYSKLDGLLKKHGVKKIGDWTVPYEHEEYVMFEAPSIDVFSKMMLEPEIMAINEFETFQTKIIVSTEEIMKMLPQVK